MKSIPHNKDLDMAMPAVIKSILNRSVHTSTIGKVVSFDKQQQTVDVIPIVNNGELEYKKLSEVPVIFPSGGNSNITFPIVKGDLGLLVFAERSIDESYEKRDRATPVDGRRFSISDAIYIPGLRSTSQSYSDAVEIKNGTIKIMLRNNKVAVGINGVELLDLISQTLQALSIATVMVSGVPVPLSNAAQFAILKTQLDLIKGSL